ncbi:hypothetical protein PSTT_14802 [Puccinia striiformis]|uniref:Uncharacterized protein n=1 Tax=Puccinia striiformis TaxID=27350 RepID=A0A2S4UKQ4_9BASI|nr:hypothetical protein PSTT_14802 [Puccinia striiformis]
MLLDFLCGPASPTVQSCNSGPTLQTLELLSSKKPVSRSHPAMDGAGTTSLNDLRNAGRELRLPLIDQSVARIQDPTQPGEHGILASNFRSLSRTDFRETHSLVDNLDWEVRSGLPRHDISLKQQEKSQQPHLNFHDDSPYNRPETAIDLLAKFGMSPDAETTGTHEFGMSSALSSAHSQPGFKRPMMQNYTPIILIYMRPIDKKARIYDTWSKTGQNPVIQHQPEPPTSLVKSNPQITDALPSKGVVSGMGMTSNESKSREENRHEIALLNHNDNKLKDKYLASSSGANTESLDFNLDDIAAEDKGNKIILTCREAARVFKLFSKNEYGPMTGKDNPPHHFSQNLMRSKLLELSCSPERWFKFWERISGINFDEELKGKVAHYSNEETLLLYFMLYVDMIDTIIPPSNLVTSLKDHKQNLYKDALKQFLDFKDNDQLYRSMDIESVNLHTNYSSIWNSIFHWLSKGERYDLEQLAFSKRGKKHKGFRNFFNLIFKLTSGSFTDRLEQDPKLAQHV